MNKVIIALAAYTPTVTLENQGDVLVLASGAMHTTIAKNDSQAFNEVARIMADVAHACNEANEEQPTYHLALGNEDNDVPTTSAVLSYSDQLLVINPDGSFDCIGG